MRRKVKIYTLVRPLTFLKDDEAVEIQWHIAGGLRKGLAEVNT